MIAKLSLVTTFTGAAAEVVELSPSCPKKLSPPASKEDSVKRSAGAKAALASHQHPRHGSAMLVRQQLTAPGLALWRQGAGVRLAGGNGHKRVVARHFSWHG